VANVSINNVGVAYQYQLNVMKSMSANGENGNNQSENNIIGGSA
jgi:hypothetical protein